MLVGVSLFTLTLKNIVQRRRSLMRCVRRDGACAAVHGDADAAGVVLAVWAAN